MDKVADKALELLKALAEKIYPYFVRQVYIEGWIGVLVGILACAGFGIGGRLLFGYCKSMKQAKPDKHWGAGMFFSGFIIALTTLALGYVLYSHLPSILNPEYDAIRRIVDLTKGK